jgi:hypothetical protein
MKRLLFVLLIMAFGPMSMFSQTDEGNNHPGTSVDIIHMPHRGPKKGNSKVLCETMDDVLTLTFLTEMSNIEFLIYKEGTMIVDDCGINATIGQIKIYDMSVYGDGTYSVTVVENGSVLWSEDIVLSSENN